MAHAELHLRRIGAVAASLVAIIVLVVVAAFALLDAWRAPAGGADASATQRDARSLPSAPQDDLRAHRAARRAWLDSAGWVDEAHGIAHVPIEDARGILVEEGEGEGGRGKRNSPGYDGFGGVERRTHDPDRRADEPEPKHEGGAADARGRSSPAVFSPSPSPLPPSLPQAHLPLGAASTPPAVDFDPRPGARLPLDLALVGVDGASTSLRAQFAGSRPVVLVLGYYTCPNLCGVAMHGIVEALHDTGLPVDDYRIVGVSIDPQDGAAEARARAQVYQAYARFVFGSRPAPELRLFVAAAPAIDALAAAVGFGVEPAPDDALPARFAHPTGFVVATPDGRISRTVTGVRFDARALRLAIVDASSGRVDVSSGRMGVSSGRIDASSSRIGGFSDRVRLLCAHFDPQLSRYGEATMNAARITGLVTLLLLGGWILRRLRGAHGRRSR